MFYDLLSFLRTGVASDFHKFGKIPVFMILLKILLNGRVIYCLQNSIMRPERPYALLTFNIFMTSKFEFVICVKRGRVLSLIIK